MNYDVVLRSNCIALPNFDIVVQSSYFVPQSYDALLRSDDVVLRNDDTVVWSYYFVIQNFDIVSQSYDVVPQSYCNVLRNYDVVLPIPTFLLVPQTYHRVLRCHFVSLSANRNQCYQVYNDWACYKCPYWHRCVKKVLSQKEYAEA